MLIWILEGYALVCHTTQSFILSLRSSAFAVVPKFLVIFSFVSVSFKKIPVLVACDRQSHMVIDVLDHMWWEDMEARLVGRIPRGTPVCADALAQHDRVAQRLGFVLKTLVTAEGQTARTRGCLPPSACQRSPQYLERPGEQLVQGCCQ